jgi:hypothetical protein
LLVFVWSWYYLGSQAAKWEYTYRQSGSYHKTPVFFQAPEAPSSFATGLSDTRLTAINALFGFEFVSPPTGVDTLGGAMVPMLNQDSAPSGALKSVDQKTGWVVIGSVSDLSWSGILGPLLYTADSDGNVYDRWLGNYDGLSTAYSNADCSDAVVGPASDYPGTRSTNTTFYLPNNTQSVVEFWHRYGDQSVHSRCALQKHSVQISGSCDATGCAVHRYRQEPGSTLTPSFGPFQNRTFSQLFFDNLLLSNGGSGYAGANLTLALPASGLWTREDWPLLAQVNASETRIFSTTLTMLINTYLAASQPYSAYDYQNQTILEIVAGQATALGDIWALGHGKGASYNPEYHLSWPWLAVDIVTCLILFFGALACFWLRIHTVAPDVFGYVSSMTRDNPHLHLPEGGTAMSGLERARALKKIKVKLTDLSSDREVGRIGLTVADEAHANSKLMSTKQYV